MKFHVRAYSTLVIAFLITYSFQETIGQNAIIRIDTDRKIGEISPDIYGGFLEPIKEIVYGSLYHPESDYADENGFRTDLIDLLKALKITNVRWPGGNYVSGYNWEDGIGPKDLRPARLDLAWKVIDKNQMGTDEYVKFCNLIGAKNFICINTGTGTLDQARYWVEYCNVDQGTHYSDLRRKYSSEKPYNIKYWALGNEPDGWWQLGHKSVEDYCKFAKEAAKIMRQTDRSIKLIAAGASDYSPDKDWIGWNRSVLNNLVGYIDYISMHRYIKSKDGFGETNNSFGEFMAVGCDLDQKIGIVKSQINEILVQSGSKKPIYIAFDEYTGQGVDLASSLMLAQFLNAFIRHADIVKIANYSFLTRLVSDSPDGHFKNAKYHSFYLFSNNCFGSSVDVYVDCEKYNTPRFENVPYLDVSAVYNESDNLLIINVVNRHGTNAISAEIELQTGDIEGNIYISEVNGESIASVNTSKEQNVNITTLEKKGNGNTIQHAFSAHSFTQIKLTLN